MRIAAKGRTSSPLARRQIFPKSATWRILWSARRWPFPERWTTSHRNMPSRLWSDAGIQIPPADSPLYHVLSHAMPSPVSLERSISPCHWRSPILAGTSSIAPSPGTSAICLGLIDQIPLKPYLVLPVLCSCRLVSQAPSSRIHAFTVISPPLASVPCCLASIHWISCLMLILIKHFYYCYKLDLIIK